MINKIKKYLFFKREAFKEYNSFEKMFTVGRGFSLLKSEFLLDKYRKNYFDAHYFYHPIWAYKIIRTIKPERHVDISSINHFAGFLSVDISTDYYEYRKPPIFLQNLHCKEADLTNLKFDSNSLSSLSCMHTVEHIGLGRYGDEINPDADLLAINELKRVLKLNGDLFFVVPVGVPRVYFNSHRVYSYEMIIDLFADLSLANFSLITDKSEFLENANPGIVKDQNYGCGCFHFKKY
jgi:SAM-dependent methyltransferase